MKELRKKALDRLILLFTGWHSLDMIPPNMVVIVKDKDGNQAYGQPTYYPFDVVKMPGDEKKLWGWRGTVVFHEGNKETWDGGWMTYLTLKELFPLKGSIVRWRYCTKAEQKKCL